MVLEYTISKKLMQKINKLSKKDVSLKKAIFNKINEIIDSDEITILHYKFLKYDSEKRQRVHIKKHFVLTFIYLKENAVVFLDFDHHDKIYK